MVAVLCFSCISFVCHIQPPASTATKKEEKKIQQNIQTNNEAVILFNFCLFYSIHLFEYLWNWAFILKCEVFFHRKFHFAYFEQFQWGKKLKRVKSFLENVEILWTLFFSSAFNFGSVVLNIPILNRFTVDGNSSRNEQIFSQKSMKIN